MDVSELSLGPWFSHGTQLCSGSVFSANVVAEFKAEADAKHAALARNAFDVMVRRGWFPISVPGRGMWRCGTRGQHFGVETIEYADPFTALVEADKWYREHVEKAS